MLRRNEHTRPSSTSKADVSAHPWDVRFTPKSGHWLSVSGCPFVPKADILRCGKERRYSITSSAVESSFGGTVRPSIRAVAALMTSSSLLTCNTGRSAGLAPFRMRPA